MKLTIKTSRHIQAQLTLSLKLGFDGRLIYHGPYFRNSVVPKFIEHIFGKRNSFTINLSAGDMGRIGDKQLDVETEIDQGFRGSLSSLQG